MRKAFSYTKSIHQVNHMEAFLTRSLVPVLHGSRLLVASGEG
jgi:hypothetical protein